MTIVLLVEGATETALKEKLKQFLDVRAQAQNKPRVRLRTKDIMTLNRDRLGRRVESETTLIRPAAAHPHLYLGSARKQPALFRRMSWMGRLKREIHQCSNNSQPGMGAR